MRIILLMGPSSAGKTTLCAELKASHQWEVVSGDEVNERIFAEIIAKIKPELFKRLDEEKHTVTELRKYMNDDQIFQFSMRGTLTISKDGKEYVHQFPNPTLPNLKNVLENATLNENEVRTLAPLLTLATKKGEVTEIDFWKRNAKPDLIKSLFDEVFSHKDLKSTLVIDIIPDEGGKTAKLLEDFHNRANQFQKQHGKGSLDVFTVLAYCPPQKLSDRIKRRNIEADKDKNPQNKREGLFPFHQLSELLKSGEKKVSSNVSFGSISRDELFNISSDHIRPSQNTNKNGSSIFIENPDDPNALQAVAEPNETRPKLKITSNSAVKLDLSNDDDLIEPTATEQPRIGTKETIVEYGMLTKKFGFFNDQERISLSMAPGLKFDAIIDTAKGDAKSLAKELIDKIEQNTEKKLNI